MKDFRFSDLFVWAIVSALIIGAAMFLATANRAECRRLFAFARTHSDTLNIVASSNVRGGNYCQLPSR